MKELQTLYGLTTVKDLNSVYINLSSDVIKLLGWDSIDNCYGKTDYDIPCEASKWASQYIRQDKLVFSKNKKLQTLDIQNYKSGLKILITNREPIIDEKHACMGLLTQAIDVSNTICARYYYKLLNLDKIMMDESERPRSYILNSDYCPLILTEKQELCLFHFIRGKSIKEIAKLLQLSPRTIEDHLYLIKCKLKCNSKRELIEKAIDNGFLFYIPNKLTEILCYNNMYMIN